MMYAKLALRNVRRTARDYLIYVVTLVLSVGMFYGFFSLVSPYYNATLPVPIHLDVLKKMMRIAVPLVGLFVVFLMSYVNSYMLRRKQKEFAIETIIGMEQKTVAFLFFLETSVMGAAAILLGVLLGMLLSQIISVIVVQSFGENYHLHLSLFPDTFLGTVIFFGAIVLLLGIKNLFAVRKLKIIQMLQNSQKDSFNEAGWEVGGGLYRSFNCDPWDDGCSKLFGFTLSGSSFQGIVSDFPGCWLFGISCVFLSCRQKEKRWKWSANGTHNFWSC